MLYRSICSFFSLSPPYYFFIFPTLELWQLKMSDPSLEISSDMSGRKIFELIGSAAVDGSAARLGKMSLPGKKAIETPTFFAVTSRGAVPHLTPDNLKRHTSVSGVYMALEDCRSNLPFSMTRSFSDCERQSLRKRSPPFSTFLAGRVHAGCINSQPYLQVPSQYLVRDDARQLQLLLETRPRHSPSSLLPAFAM